MQRLPRVALTQLPAKRDHRIALRHARQLWYRCRQSSHGFASGKQFDARALPQHGAKYRTSSHGYQSNRRVRFQFDRSLNEAETGLCSA